MKTLIKISHPGKTDTVKGLGDAKNDSSGGFILLRTLILSLSIILLLSAGLIIIASLLKNVSTLRSHAEQLITNRNLQTYRELDERT